MRKFLVSKFPAVTNLREAPNLFFLAVPNSSEEIELTYFPGSGPVQVQEDLMHLAFEVESMDEFSKHLEKVGYSFSGPNQEFIRIDLCLCGCP